MKTIAITLLTLFLALSAQASDPQSSDFPRDGALEIGSGGSCPRPSFGSGSLALDVTALSISGSETPVANTSSGQYGASGGKPPYTWSFGGGTINSTGMITAISSCSSAGSARWSMVTVRDSIGQMASIEVRLPGGTWSNATNYSSGCGTCSIQNWCQACSDQNPNYTIGGVTTYVYGDYFAGNSVTGRAYYAYEGRFRYTEKSITKWSKTFAPPLFKPKAWPISDYPADKTRGPCSSYYQPPNQTCNHTGLSHTAAAVQISSGTRHEWVCQ